MRKTLLVVLVLAVVGCGSTSQDRMDGLLQFLGWAQDTSAKIDEDIAAVEQGIADLIIAADDPSLTSEQAENIVTALQLAETNLVLARSGKVKIDTAIAQARADIEAIAAEGDADIGTEIRAVGATISASAATLPPPYGAYAGLIGLAVTTIGGIVTSIFARRQTLEERASTREIIIGVEKSRAVGADLGAEGLETALRAATSPKTKAMIATVKTTL